MSSPEIDIIQRPFDRKNTRKWEGTLDKGYIFFQMYIQEKYKNIVYHSPFSLLGYNAGYYFTREKLGYVDENKDIRLTETQKKIQTVGAVITSIGVGVAVASKVQDHRSNTRKNKSIENS